VSALRRVPGAGDPVPGRRERRRERLGL